MTRLFAILPTVFLSWSTYVLSVIRFPRFFPVLLITVFRKMYKIDMNEVDGELKSFRTLADFFIRRLNPEARPVDNESQSVISPVDGFIVETGTLDDDTVLTVKGAAYTAAQLLGDSDKGESFRNGVFAVIHLRPFDYHRIHTPLSGNVTGHSLIKGRLLPVHEKGRKCFGNVYARNKRRITYIQAESGEYALIKVGAFNVGRIPVEYPVPLPEPGKEGTVFQKGSEIARFELGSTVVLMFPENMVSLADCIPGENVRCGSRIGKLLTK